MAVIEPNFIYGVIRKSLAVGAIAATIGWLAMGTVELGLAVLVGTLISALNLRTVAWAIRKMLEAGRDGDETAGAWTLVLAGKLLALIASVWVLIAYAGVDAVGFALGFSSFLPAIGWQMLVSSPYRDDEADTDEEVG